MEILRRVSKNIGKSSGLKSSAVVIYWIFRNVLHKVSILFCNSVLWHHILQHLNSLKWAIICDALRNLLPFKQFKKHEKRFSLQLYYKYHTFMGNWNEIIWMLNPFFQKCCWNPMTFLSFTWCYFYVFRTLSLRCYRYHCVVIWHYS